MNQTPILFLGDSPSLRGGLSRIGKDLACLVSTLPEFRVGYLGRGGMLKSQFPFTQYNFPESEQWGENYVEQAYNDFAGETKGIIFSIWDLSRLHWFSRPDLSPGVLYNFLSSSSFSRWGYFPIDGRSVTGTITGIDADTLSGYNRRLAYSRFGSQILNSDWIPHGINMDKFVNRDKIGGRLKLGYSSKDIVIGCVMANQRRKDWALACSTAAELYRLNKKVRFWFHIDTLTRSHAWNLPALIADYKIGDIVRVTLAGEYNDTEMSYLYSACDLTYLPSLGEGFGYPIAESLSCNIPCIIGNYAAGPELILDKSTLVEPENWIVEGHSNNLRPVYNPSRFVQQMNNCLDCDKINYRESIEYLDWKMLWKSCWKKWFLGGLV